jgi:hypothetical protein
LSKRDIHEKICRQARSERDQQWREYTCNPWNGTESTLDVTIASAALDGELEWYVHGDLCNHYPALIRLMDRLEEQTRRPMWGIKSSNWDKFKNKTQAEVENNEFSDAESFTTMMIKCAKE